MLGGKNETPAINQNKEVLSNNNTETISDDLDDEIPF